MEKLCEYARRRNEALFSLDYDKIMAFFNSNSQNDDLSEIDTETFWLVVYKMICNIKDPPEPVLRKAKEWIREHGYSEMIQPLVIHDIYN